MNENRQSVLRNSLIKKRGSQISPYEAQQMGALGDIYGTNLVINAVRFSKSGSIHEIARLLMQMGGFPKVVPTTLNGLIFDYETAGKKYSNEQMKVAGKLRLASKPLSESYLSTLYLSDRKNIFEIWKSATKSELTLKEDKWAI